MVKSTNQTCSRLSTSHRPACGTKKPMGKNTINNIMKTMKENSPLKDVCSDKKLTNHSARKKVVKKLKTSSIPKCEIKNITGHISEQRLDDYDSADENEQRVMSNIIDNATNARQVFQPLPSVQTGQTHVYNQLLQCQSLQCDAQHR